MIELLTRLVNYLDWTEGLVCGCVGKEWALDLACVLM